MGYELTHVITGNTSVLRERRTIGNNEHTWEDVRWMRGRRLEDDLPGTKVVKEAKATTAQKSSHQNIRFWRRRAIRTIVIRPDTRKKPKEESGLHVNW